MTSRKRFGVAEFARGYCVFVLIGQSTAIIAECPDRRTALKFASLMNRATATPFIDQRNINTIKKSASGARPADLAIRKESRSPSEFDVVVERIGRVVTLAVFGEEPMAEATCELVKDDVERLRLWDDVADHGR